MNSHPGFLGRMMALVQGEVSASELEAYRRAGDTVYKLLQQAEDHRLAHKIQGKNPWQVEPAHQALFLATWNAFVLQTLGDQFLEADYQANPATVGYVPKVTAEQVLGFYAPVEAWLGRAQQAQSNPGYRLDVRLPAELPAWAKVEPCPRPHLQAMLAAGQGIRAHAESAFAVFEGEGLPIEQKSAVQQLKQKLAAANAKLEYAQALWGEQLPQGVHQKIEEHVKAALEGYYQLGQYLAMPDLLEKPQPSGKPSQRTATRPSYILPGQPGFDPWVLTDPRSVEQWKADPQARQAIQFQWDNDPDPARTLGTQAEINQALLYGDIEHAGIGHYYCCPWAPIYDVRKPVNIGGVRLEPRQQFTYDVSAEEIPKGGDFKREIMVGNFQPTSQVDYCDPRSGGQDDG